MSRNPNTPRITEKLRFKIIRVNPHFMTKEEALPMSIKLMNAEHLLPYPSSAERGLDTLYNELVYVQRDTQSVITYHKLLLQTPPPQPEEY